MFISEEKDSLSSFVGQITIVTTRMYKVKQVICEVPCNESCASLTMKGVIYVLLV